MKVGAWLVKGRLARQRRRAGFALSVGTSAVASCSTLSIAAPISVASPALRSKVSMPGWHARAAQSSGPNATARPADDAPRPAETSVQAALREVACGIDNRGAFDAGWSATDPASDRLRRDALAGRAETVGALRALLQVWFVRACLLAHFGHGVLSTASEDDTIDALGASPAARSLSGSSSGIGRRCCTAVASCAAPVGGGCSASPLPATSSKRSVVDMEAALASTAAMLLSERERGSVCQAHLCGNCEIDDCDTARGYYDTCV